MGNEESVSSVAEAIRAMNFAQYEVPGEPATGRLIKTLTPQVFLKQKNRKGKGVDIQMTVDILTNIYQNNIDTVFLVSGDGDYYPVIAECQRLGKQVFVSALSSGLNAKLRLSADFFVDLDGQFFHPPEKATPSSAT